MKKRKRQAEGTEKLQYGQWPFFGGEPSTDAADAARYRYLTRSGHARDFIIPAIKEAQANAKPEIAIAEAYRCGAESGDAKIAELLAALRYLVEAILTRADADYMKRQMNEAVRVLALHGITPPVLYCAAIAKGEKQ